MRATVRAIDEEVEDERYEKMGLYFKEERDAIIREVAQRK